MPLSSVVNRYIRLSQNNDDISTTSFHGENLNFSESWSLTTYRKLTGLCSLLNNLELTRFSRGYGIIHHGTTTLETFSFVCVCVFRNNFQASGKRHHLPRYPTYHFMDQPRPRRSHQQRTIFKVTGQVARQTQRQSKAMQKWLKRKN